ncbi:MAG: hypothetical protein WDN30_05605 [Pararobbsia sp.]
MSKSVTTARRQRLAGLALVAAAFVAPVDRTGYAREMPPAGMTASDSVSGGFAATAPADAAANASRFDPAHRNVSEPPTPGDAQRAPPIRAQSIYDSSVDPFIKQFPRTRKPGHIGDTLETERTEGGALRSVFEMPGQMREGERDDPRRTGELHWVSPPPSDAAAFGERLQERVRDPAAP